ncbi:MAG: WD40 repeat domain-containing protein [Actinomycetota bacterium]
MRIRPFAPTLILLSSLFPCLLVAASETEPEVPPAFELTGHDMVFGFDWSPDGKQLIVADSEYVRIWNVETRTFAKRWERQTAEYCPTWSPDGKWVTTCADEGKVLIRDTNSWKVVRSLRFGNSTPGPVVWRPDSKAIAVANHDKFGVFEPTTEKLLVKLGVPGDFVYGLAWRPDGKEIVAGGTDNIVRTWDALTWKPVFKLVVEPRLPSHSIGLNEPRWSDIIQSLSWSHDGEAVAAGCMDGMVRIWPPGHKALVLPAHAVVKLPDKLFGASYAGVNAVCWDPSGSRLASVGADGRLRVWRRKSFRLMLNAAAFPGRTGTGGDEEGGARDLAWSPDGKWLAVAGRTNVVRVWAAPAIP